jgi:hypothetical protein
MGYARVPRKSNCYHSICSSQSEVSIDDVMGKIPQPLYLWVWQFGLTPQVQSVAEPWRAYDVTLTVCLAVAEMPITKV